MRVSRATASVIALLGVVAAVVSSSASVGTDASRGTDPPLLVAWTRVGDIALGEPRTRLEREYGGPGHGYHPDLGYYRLHGSRVFVYFRDSRVNDVDFTTRYYRTKSGFGVGSRIPLGPCHRTATQACEHRWHGFVWNPTLRESPCGCWVKVGLGAQSLPVSGANFLKPWTIIYTRFTGRATEIYLALKYVD